MPGSLFPFVAQRTVRCPARRLHGLGSIDRNEAAKTDESDPLKRFTAACMMMYAEASAKSM